VSCVLSILSKKKPRNYRGLSIVSMYRYRWDY